MPDEGETHEEFVDRVNLAIEKLEVAHAYVNTLFDAIQSRRAEIIAEEKTIVKMIRQLSSAGSLPDAK